MFHFKIMDQSSACLVNCVSEAVAADSATSSTTARDGCNSRHAPNLIFYHPYFTDVPRPLQHVSLAVDADADTQVT